MAKKPAGSYESRMQAMDAAVRAAKPQADMYVDQHHDDHVVVRDWKENTFWRVGCSFAKDGTVTLGDWTEVEQVYAEVKKALRLLVPVQKAVGVRRITYGVVLEPDSSRPSRSLTCVSPMVRAAALVKPAWT